jgi:hypothetical protein
MRRPSPSSRPGPSSSVRTHGGRWSGQELVTEENARGFGQHQLRFSVALVDGGVWPCSTWIHAVLIASAVVAAFAYPARRIGLQIHLELRR